VFEIVKHFVRRLSAFLAILTNAARHERLHFQRLPKKRSRVPEKWIVTIAVGLSLRLEKKMPAQDRRVRPGETCADVRIFGRKLLNDWQDPRTYVDRTGDA
jgi:hypothetical protein